MKKLIVIVGLCIMFCVTSSATVCAMAFNTPRFERPLCPLVSSPPLDDPPGWATGNFTGEWGLNILGEPFIPSGWVNGYYSDFLVLRFEGFVGEYYESDPIGYIEGIILGPYLMGVIGNSTSNEETCFVGIGDHNDTSSEFYWRVMALEGPTFYLYGTYRAFS